MGTRHEFFADRRYGDLVVGQHARQSRAHVLLGNTGRCDSSRLRKFPYSKQAAK
jgi:hypothetical protein